jgi:pre-mRNA-splicing factor ISY1
MPPCTYAYIDPLNKRPLAASECQSLPDAEKARRGLLKEISKKIALIQNGGFPLLSICSWILHEPNCANCVVTPASLGESRLRELNDEINKHLRQKHFWEARIRELGGGDLRGARSTQLFEVEGRELPGAPGYRYFGAAKELPGVRELFAEHDGALAEQSLRRQQQRSRAEIHRGITPDYFGFRDEEDGVLLPKEAAWEVYIHIYIYRLDFIYLEPND